MSTNNVCMQCQQTFQGTPYVRKEVLFGRKPGEAPPEPYCSKECLAEYYRLLKLSKGIDNG